MTSILADIATQQADLSGVLEASRDSRGQGGELQISCKRARRVATLSLVLNGSLRKLKCISTHKFGGPGLT